MHTEPKRLLRYPDQGMIGGVCIGLGEYFGLDPILIRIIFLILLFFVGGGLLAYLIFWIAMPSASGKSPTV